MIGDILDNSKTYLRIFVPGNFEVDMTLPKFKKEQEKMGRAVISETDSNINLDGGGELLIRSQFINNIRINSVSDNMFSRSDALVDSSETHGDKFLSPFSRLIEYFTKKKKEKKEEKLLDVIKFFEEVKLTTKDAQKDYIESINEFRELLKNANDMGQWALVDDILHRLDTYKLEAILHAEGHLYKISEEKLVDLVKKTEKGLRLDWIKNFTRVIPKEVIEAKRKADELKIFDNYVVLHYDPEKKAVKQTKKEEEKERKKKADPILFGVIEHSRDLYYITDWVDEKCNLTLDELVKLMKVDKSSLEIKKPTAATILEQLKDKKSE